MSKRISPEIVKAIVTTAIELLHKFDLSGSEAEAIYNGAVLPANKEVQPDGLPYGIVDPDYARIFTIARTIAWSEGYAITMHGSFTRDLDMLAVPWNDNPCTPEKLVARIVDAAKLRQTGHPPGVKPQGRLAWTFLLSDTKQNFSDPRFVDLSVIPPQPPIAKETKHGIAHTCAGFRAGFESDFRRKPTDQEIWNHAIRSYKDLQETENSEKRVRKQYDPDTQLPILTLEEGIKLAAKAADIKIVENRFNLPSNDFSIEILDMYNNPCHQSWEPHRDEKDCLELLVTLITKHQFHSLKFESTGRGVRVFADGYETSAATLKQATMYSIIFAGARIGYALQNKSKQP